MTPEANRALIRRWLEAADAGFATDFGAFFAPGYRGHLSGRIHMDLDELVRLERGFAAAFSDVERNVEDLLSGEDKVILRLTTSATHSGDWQGISATGRRVTFSAMVIYRIADARIVESWGEVDFASVWRQLTAQRASDAVERTEDIHPRAAGIAGSVRPWWQSFFDGDYLRLWEGIADPARTEREVAGLWTLLDLHAGSRVLDAPCGYGRIALGLAQRGARVLGVDFSSSLLAEAERRRGAVPPERLEHRAHDLREPLAESEFDVALNVFTSLGYGSEADDLAILSTLRAAVRPGGRVFIETMHRDQAVIFFTRTERQAYRLRDGALFVEEPRFDAVSGRVESVWWWSGPTGSGEKRSSLRLYSATELAALAMRAGLRVLSVHGAS